MIIIILHPQVLALIQVAYVAWLIAGASYIVDFLSNNVAGHVQNDNAITGENFDCPSNNYVPTALH